MITKKKQCDKTLCEKCDMARFTSCKWVLKGVPIDGWSATATVIKVGTHDMPSFIVRKCPRYIAESKRKTISTRGMSQSAASKLTAAVLKQTLKDYNKGRHKYFNTHNIDFLFWCDISGIDPENFIRMMKRR